MSYRRAQLLDDGSLHAKVGYRLRMVAGNCPDCGSVVAVLNGGEGWPLMSCLCGWRGDTHSPLNKVRVEKVEP